jgi:hypothetical protein
MGRAIATLTAVLILALLAGGLTEATLAYGHGVGQDNFARPSSTTKPATSSTPKPTPVPATPTPTPAATPVPTPSAATATTNSFVHMREGMSTSTAIILNLNADSVVTLLSGGDSTWQEVEYDGYQGYVYTTYLSY